MTLMELDEFLGGDLRPYHGKVCGVYFLANNDNEIIYVGQSQDLATRVNQHSKDKQFATVHYLDISRENLARFEAWLISVCKPALNRCIPYFSNGASYQHSRPCPTIDVPNLEEFI